MTVSRNRGTRPLTIEREVLGDAAPAGPVFDGAPVATPSGAVINGAAGRDLADWVADAGANALSGFRSTVAGLSTEVPLALFPVRLTTRYSVEGDKIKLRVRIFPDVLHTPPTLLALSEEEKTLAQSFWQAAFTAGSDAAARLEAFRTLCADFAAPWRAAYAARATRPTNWADPPPATKPVFGAVPAPAATERLLPQRFVVIGWKGGTVVLGPQVGAQIPADLKLVPETSVASAAGASDWLAAQGLKWMEDYDEAVRVGLGVTVDVTGTAAQSGVDLLLVLGVRTPDDLNTEADRLEALLAAHAAEHGVELLATGTPTNNTDEDRSGFSLSTPKLESLLAEVLFKGGATPAADDLRKALGLNTTSLLHRSTGAASNPDALARAMNGALWPAGTGWLLRSGLPLGLAESDIAAARDHFIGWVRGGGRFSALRTGPTPWGILPIRPDAAWGSSFLERLGSLLDKLEPTWQAGVSAVERMDPDAADQPATGAVSPDAISRVSSVLSAVPNPVRFAHRLVESQQGMYEFQYFLFTMFVDAALTGGAHILATEQTLAAELVAAKTVEEEITAWKKARDAIKSFMGSDSKLNAVYELMNDYVVPLLEAHLARIRPVLNLGVDRTLITGKLSSAYSSLFFAFYEADAKDWGGPIVGANPAASFAALLTQLGGGALATENPPSLLFTLLQRSISKVHANDKASFTTALTSLRDLAATLPAGAFGLAMRESLGAMMYRLDAWQASIASRTFDEKRGRRARGLNVGAWGVVVDLKRRTTEQPISQGFLHTPSLAQAVTGAVLRSGWSALGSDGQTSPLSVDLSSDRVRRAEEILDAIRAGEALSVLLGQRLERRMHDAALDRFVDSLRSLASAGRGGSIGVRASMAPSDGQAIARAWSGGDSFAPLTAAEQALRTSLNALVATVPTVSDGRSVAPRGRFTQVLDDTLADLDAVADVLIAEGVHNLLQGNPSRASAALSALGSGETPPPELWMPKSDRGGISVTHRLTLVLPMDIKAAAAWPGAALSPSSSAEPRLESWVADRLGSPADIGFVAVRASGRFGLRLYDARRPETALGALDFVRLCDDGGDLERYALDLAARTYPGEALTVDLSDAGGAKLALSDAALAALALRHALHGAKVLRPTSLLPPNGSGSDLFDLSELSARATATKTVLSAARAALSSAISAVKAGSDEATLIPQILLSQARGLPVRGETRVDGAERALAELDRRLALPAPAATLAGWTGYLQDLAGRKLPILPLFTATDGAGIDASLARGRGGAGEALGWLGQAAKVREGAATLAEAIDSVEAARDDAVMSDVRIAQLPDDGGAWAAKTAPPGDRLSALVLGPKTAKFTAPVCGLLFDSWQETVPASTQTTGVALHLDAPGAQPPQLVLLGVVPGSGVWDLDGLAARVKDVVAQAKRRMVGPENLPSLGQYLPGVSLSDTAGGT